MISDIDDDAAIALVGHLDAVPTILQVLCTITGMGFAAVAPVTEGTWTACAVLDKIAFGLVPGSSLDVGTTLCKEVRVSGLPIVIDHASEDAVYRTHRTPKLYGIENYVSVPIILPGGQYFGNLCAIDPKPAKVSEPAILAMFVQFSELIARQLHNERKSQVVQEALLRERCARDRRDQLFSMMSHDLRGPIGSIALGCQRLKANAGDPGIVVAIALEVAKSAKLAASMLRAAPVAGMTALSDGAGVGPGFVDRIDEVFFDVLTDVQESFKGREIEWNFDVSRPVRVDRCGIQQLAANLLRNALQCSAPLGKTRITATTTASEFVLSVWNDGQRLSPEKLADAFAPTWSAFEDEPTEALALDLHLSLNIVKAHGGRLSVASDERSGTTLAAVFAA